MNRCYECGKRDWRIGSAYQAIRSWIRIKVGLDQPPPKPSPETLKMLARSAVVYRHMTEIPPMPPATSRVIYSPIRYTDPT